MQRENIVITEWKSDNSTECKRESLLLHNIEHYMDAKIFKFGFTNSIFGRIEPTLYLINHIKDTCRHICTYPGSGRSYRDMVRVSEPSIFIACSRLRVSRLPKLKYSSFVNKGPNFLVMFLE